MCDLSQHLPVLPPLQQRMRRPLSAAEQGRGVGIGRRGREAGGACKGVVSRSRGLLLVLLQRRALEGAEPIGVHGRVASHQPFVWLCAHQWEGLQIAISRRHRGFRLSLTGRVGEDSRRRLASNRTPRRHVSVKPHEAHGVLWH